MSLSPKGCLKFFVGGVALLAIAIAFLFVTYILIPVWGWGSYDSRHGNVPITPAWALEPWVWEDDVNTADFVHELLAGYKAHDIPVRTILIDSPWSTRYNDFIVDEKRYPEPEKFFTGLQDEGYRVVLWMTCMVDSMSKDTAIEDSTDWYQEAADKGYLASDGYQMPWWKGKGGFIDYTNPDAMKWWRGMQQQVFDWGIDGWKLDGTATFFNSLLFGFLPAPYGKTHSGMMSMRTYMDHYYRDEYLHGLTQNPEFITLGRAIDGQLEYGHMYGFAPLDASATNWVGDQDHAWAAEDEGIEEAIRDILRSAKLGYNVVGSDVGGYSGGEIPPAVYIRWAQFSVFCGLFMQGGHGERRLWLRSEEELELIRVCHWLHNELVPYMYSHGVECHKGGKPLMRPTDDDYQYLFGDDFFVAPIYVDSTHRRVNLPAGEWRYFYDDKDLLEGPTVVQREFPMEEFPVYIREGAIIPMNIEREYTGIGERDWSGHVAWNCYPKDESAFTLHHADGEGETTLKISDNDTRLILSFSGRTTPHVLRIYSEAAPSSINLDGAPLSQGEKWNYIADDNRIIIKNDWYEKGEYTVNF